MSTSFLFRCNQARAPSIEQIPVRLSHGLEALLQIWQRWLISWEQHFGSTVQNWSKIYFTFFRYDHNELCNIICDVYGKDKSDRENADVKSVMNSYISSDKDMVNDMFSAVH